jgi:Fe-S-cluster containining protein
MIRKSANRFSEKIMLKQKTRDHDPIQSNWIMIWPMARFRAKRKGMETSDPAVTVEGPCQACGACCSYSSNWPRFTTEDDAALDLIPVKFVNEKQSGMRCEGERCSALSGRIGIATSCGIYAVRPEVCRTCMPGDVECDMARRRHGLPALV